MSIKLGDFKKAEYLKPEEKGVKVYLAKLPEYIEGDKGNSISFLFKGATDKNSGEFDYRLFDMFDAPSEKARNNGFDRLLHIYSSLMSPQNAKVFAEMEVENLKDVVMKGNKMLDPNIINIELTIMVGYSHYNGYLGMPAFGSVISSPLQDPVKELVFNPSLISLKPVKGTANSSKPDKESSSDGEEDLV